MNYYYTNNASRAFKTATHRFKFEPVSLVGGVADGVYSTSDPGEIAALDQLVKEGKLVSKTEVQYNELIQKKTLTHSGQISSVQPAPEPFTGSLVAPAEAAKPVKEEPPALPKFERVEDALQVDKVKAPETFVPRAKRPTKRSKKTLP